jgi:hypothetical protein
MYLAWPSVRGRSRPPLTPVVQPGYACPVLDQLATGGAAGLVPGHRRQYRNTNDRWSNAVVRQGRHPDLAGPRFSRFGRACRVW